MANNGTSPDGRNYTFQLRTDVMFHDQTRMTATDVSSSFRRLLAIHPADGPSRILEGLMTNRISTLANADCNPSIAGTQNCTIGDWANVTFPARSAVPAYMSAALPPEPSWDTTALNVSTAWAVSNSTVAPVGNYTVVFHLLRPYSAFLPILASTVGSILSHACVGRNGGVRWGVPNSILARGAECGSGPFTLTTWSPNQAIVLTRFNQSWRGPAKIPAVHLLPVRDVVSREFLLLAGDVDTAAIDRDHQWDVMNADGTPKSPTLRIAKDRPAFDVSFFGYNRRINFTATPDPIMVPATFFADVHIRRTFTYAFDYSAFLVNVTHDAGLQPRGPIPLGLLGYNASIPLFPFDLAQAATELNATPYWTSGFNLTLYYRAGSAYEEQGCRLLAQGLEALHSREGSPGVILVAVRALDSAAYNRALRDGGLPLALLSWAPRFADPLDSVLPFLRTATFIRGAIRQMMHRTVSPNLYMEAKAGAWDGGSEDDHGHGPRDDPPRSAHPGPPRNARAATTQFDSAARPDVSRVPGGESFSGRALPRRRPRRGRDGPRARPAGRGAKARPGGGPPPRCRARSVLPYLGACPEPRARGGPHAPDPADHHGPRRQRVPGGSARLPGRQADSRGARNAPGEPRGRRRADPRAVGERRGSARARKPEGVEALPRADHPQPDGCRPDRLPHAGRALHGRLPRDDRLLPPPADPPDPPGRARPGSEGPSGLGGDARRAGSDVLLRVLPQDRPHCRGDARARRGTVGRTDCGHPEDGGP